MVCTCLLAPVSRNLKKMWGMHGDVGRVGTVRKLKSKLDEELTLAHEIGLANRAAVN